MRNRFGCSAALIMVAIAVIWIWLDRRHDLQLDSNFNRVRAGMSDREVITLLGEPRWRGRCGTSHYYSFIDPLEGSADCLVYSSSIAPLNPWYPVIFLGPDNRVIDKYSYASP